MLGIDQQSQEAAGGLRYGVEGGAVTVRPLAAEARDRGVNQRRIDRLQPRRIDIEAPRHARAEVLDEHVGICDQPVEHGQIFGVLGSMVIERLLRL